MKSALCMSFAVTLLALCASSLHADADVAKDVEWIMTLGCRHCNYAEQTGVTTCKGNCGPAAMKDDKVFLLSGSAIPKDFKKGGEWRVKGSLSADGKTIAVKEMTAQTPAPSELKDDQPAHSAPDAKPYSGSAGHTGAGLPTLTTADKIRYSLKPSKSASTATKYALTRIGGGELTGAFTATGATYEDDSHKWVVVDSIRPADAAPKQ